MDQLTFDILYLFFVFCFFTIWFGSIIFEKSNYISCKNSTIKGKKCDYCISNDEFIENQEKLRQRFAQIHYRPYYQRQYQLYQQMLYQQEQERLMLEQQEQERLYQQHLIVRKLFNKHYQLQLQLEHNHRKKQSQVK
ncbi:hypothetical protein DICPUDRAFT_152919 [Dictyostelium purpureum]|uniref:Transmembrane protein n=1 Tax=Dictyostelium purpureum TaxID=5786 RepID=F0ZML4_DICPU|nr:uncharacterized protein DICPUDRAFT_152919 [Dictyostelium purpureum]EGC34812.1 hypothetical protein DICPUDRAFT_152919 [Dictyostelium purpureum]|eukprot:XP_003288669.1 hypothetical protein DICPUDRAFT_152919 [Dictyostelium purpureum]